MNLSEITESYNEIQDKMLTEYEEKPVSEPKPKKFAIKKTVQKPARQHPIPQSKPIDIFDFDVSDDEDETCENDTSFADNLVRGYTALIEREQDKIDEANEHIEESNIRFNELVKMMNIYKKEHDTESVNIIKDLIRTIKKSALTKRDIIEKAQKRIAHLEKNITIYR
jgi:hypothetical protein